MEKIIVYRSILGSSKRYAYWLGEKLKIRVVKFNKVKKEELEEAKEIILVGGTYVGWMSLSGFIRKNWKYLKGKKLVMADVGLAKEKSEENKEAWEKLPIEFREEAKMFKIAGKIGRMNEENVKEENLNKVEEAVVSRRRN